MSKYLASLFILFLFSNSNCIAQGLTGVWQINSREISDTELDSYHFFSNGRFIFYPSGYDGSNRVRAIKGIFTLLNNEIIFTVDSYAERVGGIYSKEPFNSERNGWSIVNFTGLRIVKQTPNKSVSTFQRCTDTACIKIGGDTFYKISDIPKDKYPKDKP